MNVYVDGLLAGLLDDTGANACCCGRIASSPPAVREPTFESGAGY